MKTSFSEPLSDSSKFIEITQRSEIGKANREKYVVKDNIIYIVKSIPRSL